jgi:hypothetical protein
MFFPVQMIDFLKKLFKGREEPKEEPEEEKVAFQKLGEWLIEKAEDFYSDVDLRAEQLSDSIRSKKKEALELVEELRSAELRNKNIPTRAIQIMEGNRRAYISSTERFLEKIDFEKLNYKNWSDFYSLFEEEIKILARGNQKSYMVLQEFFANESNKIASKIKEIEDEISQTNKQISGKDMAGFNRLQRMAEDIRNKEKYLESNEKDIKKKQQDMKDSREELARLKDKIKSLEESDEYKKVKGLIQEKAENKQKIKDAEKELLQVFGQFDRAMKKYSKISTEPVVTLLYLKNPYKALMDDSEQKILRILSGMTESLEQGKLGLKDKQKEKTLEAIRNLDSSFFDKYIEQEKKIDDENKELDRQIKSHSIMMDIDELNYNLSHLEEKLDKMKKDLDILDKNSSKYDIKKLKNELRKEILSQLNIDVKLE